MTTIVSAMLATQRSSGVNAALGGVILFGHSCCCGMLQNLSYT